MIVVANKAEGRAGETGLLEAYALGLGEPIAISAEHGEGIVDLFEALRPHQSSATSGLERGRRTRIDDETGGPLKLAIVGRPNAGKSTLINRMLGEDRLLTGPEAGITRDSIASNGPGEGQQPVRLVDTAGMRKRPRSTTSSRSCRSPTRAARSTSPKWCVLLLDATRGLEVAGSQDRRRR